MENAVTLLAVSSTTISIIDVVSIRALLSRAAESTATYKATLIRHCEGITSINFLLPKRNQITTLRMASYSTFSLAPSAPMKFVPHVPRA